ncbi:MAG: Tfp pilus assembly protein FimT/FimU [Kiritimatiellia bacterium]
MRRAFTLVELLVVIAIMAMLGTLSVGGYRAMQSGMEDRGAMQNINQFIRSAYQRAQIDRTPVSVYFWNETRSEESDDEIMVVHGHALAVRRSGRLSNVVGDSLCDEYGDLSYNRLVVNEDEDDESSDSGSTRAGSGIYLYRLNGDEGSQPMRSVVSQTTKKVTLQELMLQSGASGEFEMYAYTLIDKNGVSWKTGDAYGFEFASIDLPNGYIFGSNYSRSLANPIAGEDVIRFKVSANSGNGAMQGTDGKSTISISRLKPNASGAVEAQQIGTTDSPTRSLN